MILTPLLTVALASLAQFATAQLDTNGPIKYDLEHNATAIVGTWSSQSNAVLTGPGFVDPAQLLFTYPKNTGVSYSFTADGHYEIARYQFRSNGTLPTCITGIIVWVHGEYTLNANGSITMIPYPDGFQQVQDPCGAESNFIETYNYREYFVGWRIFQDVTQGFKLHLYEADGRPVAPQFLRFNPPTMHPTRMLRNESWVRVDSKERRSLPYEGHVFSKRSSSFSTRPSYRTEGLLASAGLVVLAFSSLLL